MDVFVVAVVGVVVAIGFDVDMAVVSVLVKTLLMVGMVGIGAGSCPKIPC